MSKVADAFPRPAVLIETPGSVKGDPDPPFLLTCVKFL